MERMQKRGLSDVVTTVLIILLVLAAVAIIASYVLNAVNRGGAEVGGSAACTLMQLYPTSCTYVANKATAAIDTATTDYAVGDVVSYNLTLKGTKRGSDVNVKQLDALLTVKATGDIKRVETVAVPKFLETSNVYTLTSPTNLVVDAVAVDGDTVNLGTSLAAMDYSSAGVAVTVVPEGGTASATCNPSKIVDCILA